MRFYIALSLLLQASHAFVSVQVQHRPAFVITSTSSKLESTLASDAPTLTTEDDDDDMFHRGAISMQIDELAQVLGGRGRARIAWDCYILGIDPMDFFGSVISLGYDDYETIVDMLPSSRRSQKLGPDALQKLSSLYPGGVNQVEGGVAKLSYISRSGDGTTKLLLRLADGLQVEAVIIPFGGSRSTLCISSQVGCKQGCTFCATGRMGKLRSLTSDEILAQMFFAKKMSRLEGLPEITHVVFMGMGEPADNAEHVIKATEILTTRELFQLSASKVTVSTVAPSPDSFKQFAKAPCVLAWSVHAANDKLRKKLVPTTKYPMVELRQGLIDTLLQRPMNFRTTMFEVALMAGVNDTMEAADELAEFSKVIMETVPGCRLMVNLIPFNDIGHDLYEKPKMEAVDAFKKRLQCHGVFTQIRATRGDDKTAACGQLATKKAS